MGRHRAISSGGWFILALLAMCVTWPASTAAHDAGGPHLEVFTHETTPWVAEDAIGLRYTGPLDMKLAQDLSRVLGDGARRFRHVVLELDSEGGELAAVAAIVRILKGLGKDVEYLVFADEGHDVLKYENRVTCYNAITDFFRKHLAGKDEG